MLITGWDRDKLIKVREREAVQEGRRQGREETARNALAEGLPVEMIRKITGCCPGTMQSLANR